MFAGRGVGLGLGGRMNLTELSRGLNSSPASVAQYYRKQRVKRCGSEASRRSPSAALGSSGYRPSPLTQSRLARIVDVDDSESENQKQSAPSMDRAKRPPGQKRGVKQPQPEEKKKVKVKVNRGTFWAACRAVVFGTLLVLLGAAMCTIGYYNEYFALEIVILADNVTAMTPNPTKKFQFQSLTYLGPVVMGAGAFVLMMACVTTLESRDRQARIQAQIEAETTPLSRRNTANKRPPAPSTTPGPSALKTQTVSSTVDSSEPERRIRKTESLRPAKPELAAKLVAYQPAELVAAPATGNGSVATSATGGGGVVNRCFTRDDSKTASKPDTDSGPSGTTTTTLTWSKNGGPRVETDVVSNKYPSTSCIDNLIRKPDERALLQRFLEDQSRLVEDRLSRRIQQPGPQKEAASGADDGLRSASLDAPASAKIVHSCSRNFRSEEMAPRKNVVAAEVHHAGDASPSARRIPTPIDAGNDPSSTSSPNPSTHASTTPDPPFFDPSTSLPAAFQEAEGGGLRAPLIAPDALETFSPMSVTPDTPASLMQRKQLSKSQVLSPTYPPPAPSRPQSPDLDRSISGSYVTVAEGDDDFGASIDFFNANASSVTPVQRTCDTLSNALATKPSDWSSTANAKTADSANKKLYDSVFLAENLRQMASSGQLQPSKYEDKLLATDYTPKETSSEADYRQEADEKTRSHEETGVLCKDWKEMNANYLRNQHQL